MEYLIRVYFSLWKTFSKKGFTLLNAYGNIEVSNKNISKVEKVVGNINTTFARTQVARGER